ncbi:helix-turn-helix transcriptional regulator [Actinomadura sp. 9N215]|uniref:helix-turn-helix transcriptional regulator n=1 Tax=Actinomadura sp. 9N215 TaxID=3375150 RepID=UPI0037AD08B2
MQKTSSRLLTLLSLLQAHRDWSGEDLAQRLGITPRTVRRDVDRLRELGYSILAFKGPHGGYRLDAGSHLPPLLFDDGQAVALALALQSVASSSTIGEDAVRALSTVRQAMPSRLRQRIDMLQITAVQAPGSGDVPAAGTEVLVELSRVIHACEELRFDYGHDATGPVAQSRRTQPHHLVTWRGHWYLIAWDLDRDDWRTFRADRIRPRTPTGPRFTPRDLPGDDVTAFIIGRFRGTDGSASDWSCRGQVVLDLPAQAVAPFVQDGVVEDLGPGSCRLTLGSWSWTGLAAAIGRFDSDVHVIGPPQLTAAFAQLAARYAKAAGTSPATAISPAASPPQP